MSLLAKRLAARESVVEAGGHKFTLRRPTAYDLSRIRSGIDSGRTYDMLCRFVVGWDLRQIDLIPGGDPVAAPFDAEVWADYLADTQPLWGPLGDALMAQVEAHEAALGEAAKN